MLDSCGYYGDLVINNAYNALKVFKKSIRVDKEYYVMKGGFSQLINKMVDNIKKKHKLQLNKTCNSIFYNDDKFLLFIDGKPIYTKKLVLAIPQPNLFLIDFLKPYFPLFKSINCIRLTRIYSIYNKDDVWFHNIKKTTNNIDIYSLKLSPLNIVFNNFIKKFFIIGNTCCKILKIIVNKF